MPRVSKGAPGVKYYRSVSDIRQIKRDLEALRVRSDFQEGILAACRWMLRRTERNV